MSRLWLLPPAVLIVVGVSIPASAQGKDPFRPPGGAAPGAVTAPAVPGVPPQGAVAGQPAAGNLPRTGVDLEVPLAAAAAALAAGEAMRLADHRLKGAPAAVLPYA